MRIGLIAILAATAGPAAAQSPEWTYSVTPYVWVPGVTTSINTRRGTITAESDGSDALSDLDFAFMGAFEARNGRWGFIGDLLYADLSKSENTPLGALYDSAKISTKMTALSGYVAYRVYEDAQFKADVLGGFRAYSAELDLALRPGVLPGRSTQLDKTWMNLLVGGRVGMRFSDQWSADLAMDVGGFDPGDNFTWQAIATVNYEFNERWAMRAGWRYLDIEKTIDGRDVGVELSGPIIGFEYKF